LHSQDLGSAPGAGRDSDWTKTGEDKFDMQEQPEKCGPGR